MSNPNQMNGYAICMLMPMVSSLESLHNCRPPSFRRNWCRSLSSLTLSISVFPNISYQRASNGILLIRDLIITCLLAKGKDLLCSYRGGNKSETIKHLFIRKKTGQINHSRPMNILKLRSKEVYHRVRREKWWSFFWLRNSFSV